MSDLTAEERDFLVSYCMKPDNTWLALAVGQVQLELKTSIVSSFVKGLDEGVKDELEKRSLNWKRTIPTMNLEEEKPIYVMTMQDRGIKIQFVHVKGDLYMGTPKSNGDWPADLTDFLKREYPELKTNNQFWHWWFNPVENHRCIRSIEALSKLNDNTVKINYFAAKLVCFAEAISGYFEGNGKEM